MTSQSPAAMAIAKANREEAKIVKAFDELQMMASIVKHSDLPGDVKLRLYAALKAESDMLHQDRDRIGGLKKAAEISRGKQWVTSGDK